MQPNHNHTKKKRKETTNTHRKQIARNDWILFGILIGLIKITPINCDIQKHQFLNSERVDSKNIVCKTSTETMVTSVWFKETVEISFNTQGSITATQFIHDDNNVKQYSMLQRGTENCYMPSSSYTGWILVVLVIEQHQATPDSCYVSRVITTSHLETCSGNPYTVETLLRLGKGSYDSVPKNTRLIFDMNNFYAKRNIMNKFTLSSSFSYSYIDEDFMELLLLKDLSISSLSYQNIFV